MVIGANPNCVSRDSEESTALYLALKNEHYDVAEFLLRHGAYFDQEKLSSIFLEASANNKKDLVEFMLCCGMDIDAKEKNGDTAIFKAIQNRNFVMTKYLNEHGASLSIRNQDGETPFSLAHKTKSKVFINFMDNSKEYKKKNFANEFPANTRIRPKKKVHNEKRTSIDLAKKDQKDSQPKSKRKANDELFYDLEDSTVVNDGKINPESKKKVEQKPDVKIRNEDLKEEGEFIVYRNAFGDEYKFKSKRREHHIYESTESTNLTYKKGLLYCCGYC